MVGRWPPADLTESALAPNWRLASDRAIQVPGLAAERHILCLMQNATNSEGP
jgi:hypothetical protein